LSVSQEDYLFAAFALAIVAGIVLVGVMLMASAIEFKNVVFKYPAAPLPWDGINLKIKEHTKVVLLGENGSGKTTLLLHLNGLHMPTAAR